MLSDISYYTSEALTLLHSLIGIPSISREEEAAADFLQNYIEESGIMTGRSGNNIWCISPMFDTNRPTILLNSHIDTVWKTGSYTDWGAMTREPVWCPFSRHTAISPLPPKAIT